MTDRNHAGPGSAVEGDAELITAARGGDSGSFGVLYTRHIDAARRLARTLVRNPADVDDLVAEAFAKILSTLRGGGGPDLAFRAYLLTSVRNTFYDRMRRERRLEITADFSSHDAGVPFVDTAVEGLERSLAARAFARLPERWQMVLWHLEVEGETPADVAPLLGLTPNGVSALAYRARERLRQAYLQEHIADHAGVDCDWTAERLGAHVRGGLSRRETARVQDHLDTCERCRLLYVELGEVNSSLRGLLAPLVLGSAAAAYLLKPGAAAASVAAGAGGAGAAGVGGVGGVGGAGAAGAGAAGAGVEAVGAGAVGAGAAGAGVEAVGAGAMGAGASGAGAAGPGLAILHGGRDALGWARRAVTQNGPTGVAAGSAVAAAVIAIAVGTAIFAGTGPSPEPGRPNVAMPTPTEIPGFGSPGASGTGSPSPTPTGEPSPSASDTPTPAAVVPTDGTGVPSTSPTAPNPAPNPVPEPTNAPVPAPVPQPPPATAPGPRPLLVVRVAATPVGRILEGGPATIAVTVTVGAPALGLPETSIGLGPGSLLGAGLLRMDTQFPPGVRMAADHTRDGWECGASTCHRVGLTLTRSSTAAVPLEIDRGARGDLVFTVSAPGIVSATATLPDAIGAATPGSWTGKLHGTVRTIGGTGRSHTAASGTPSSSTASEPGHGTAVLPADGPVRWAGLYWSTPDPDAQAAPALLGAPGGDGATLVRPTDVRAVPRRTGAYRAFADVTDVVRAAGPGPWWVAGIGAGVARAWQLVVVTEERAGPLRQIVVDGARRGGDVPPVRTGGSEGAGGIATPRTGTVPGSWSELLTELTAARPLLRYDTGAGLLGALATATDLE